jgi:hypothetical protein
VCNRESGTFGRFVSSVVDNKGVMTASEIYPIEFSIGFNADEFDAVLLDEFVNVYDRFFSELQMFAHSHSHSACVLWRAYFNVLT